MELAEIDRLVLKWRGGVSFGEVISLPERFSLLSFPVEKESACVIGSCSRPRTLPSAIAAHNANPRFGNRKQTSERNSQRLQ
ncbi:hypothetical protein TNCV_816181 [Trichonephila clavipes]|nr:hypothetical protein TNCV_816181 [Trichonephila clavipes]